MPNCPASCGFSSMLTFASATWPARSPTTFSRIGVSIRHGPHHGAQKSTTTGSPRDRLLGDVAVVTYVRLNQRVAADGKPYTEAFDETRVWHRQAGRWRHVHFHRSAS